MKKTSPLNFSRVFLAGASLLATVPISAAPPEFDIKEMPASCRLLPAELRKREATLLADFRAQILTSLPRSDGYAFLLKPDSRNFKIATELIEVESKCCPFLQFQLTLAQESRALMLEIRGPAGSRELLEAIFRLSAPKKAS